MLSAVDACHLRDLRVYNERSLTTTARFVNGRSLFNHLRSYLTDPSPFIQVQESALPVFRALGLLDDFIPFSSSHPLCALIKYMNYFVAQADYIPEFFPDETSQLQVVVCKIPDISNLNMYDIDFTEGCDAMESDFNSRFNESSHEMHMYGTADSGLGNDPPLYNSLECEQHYYAVPSSGCAEPTIGEDIRSNVITRPVRREHINNLASTAATPAVSDKDLLAYDTVRAILLEYRNHVFKISGLCTAIQDGNITVNSQHQGQMISEDDDDGQGTVIANLVEPIGTDLKNFRCSCSAHTGLSRLSKLKKVWSSVENVCVYRASITTSKYGSDVSPHTAIFIDLGGNKVKYLPVISVLSQGRIVIDSHYALNCLPSDAPDNFTAYVVSAGTIQATIFTKFALKDGLKAKHFEVSKGCIGSIFSRLEREVHVENLSVRWDAGRIFVRVSGSRVIIRRDVPVLPEPNHDVSSSRSFFLQTSGDLVFGGGVVLD